MQNVNKPDLSELPSTRQLLKSTGIAVAVASVLLVTVVLPAEYGVDPTRVGSLFGLTEMGRIKRQLAAEAAADASAGDAAIATVPISPSAETAPAATTEVPRGVADEPVKPPVASPTPPAASRAAAPVATPPPPPARAARSDRSSITLEPDEAAEIKLVMQEGDQATFTWSADGGEVNYDTHGDGQGVSYHGYGKGTADRAEGVLTAAFNGNHGWYWRNRSGEPVTITLQTSGRYERIEFHE